MEIALILFGTMALAVAVYLWQTKHIKKVVKQGKVEDKKKEGNEIRAYEKYNFDIEPEDKRVDIKVGFWQAVKLGFGFSLGMLLLWIVVLILLTFLSVSLSALFSEFLNQTFQGMMPTTF